MSERDLTAGPREKLTPQRLLNAYACGVFPMAESADDPEIFWVDPPFRGVLPLSAFSVPKSLAKRMRRPDYEVTVNQAFPDVLSGCAAREETWINGEIRELYLGLHRLGFCHSVEVWMDGALAGGLYGVTLGAAYFGESMFSARTDASKIALTHLIARLKAGRFALLDTQFVTEHLRRFGAREAPRAAYRRALARALKAEGNFFALPIDTSPGRIPPQEILQLSNQTS